MQLVENIYNYNSKLLNRPMFFRFHVIKFAYMTIYIYTGHINFLKTILSMKNNENICMYIKEQYNFVCNIYQGTMFSHA